MVYDNDPDWSRKGGLKAALESPEGGKVRFNRFHGPQGSAASTQMLASHNAWDTEQMPINLMTHTIAASRRKWRLSA